ncbi:hypothetical protein Tco_1540801 [Tanacetum coccineum]
MIPTTIIKQEPIETSSDTIPDIKQEVAEIERILDNTFTHKCYRQQHNGPRPKQGRNGNTYVVLMKDIICNISTEWLYFDRLLNTKADVEEFRVKLSTLEVKNSRCTMDEHFDPNPGTEPELYRFPVYAMFKPPSRSYVRMRADADRRREAAQRRNNEYFFGGEGQEEIRGIDEVMAHFNGPDELLVLEDQPAQVIPDPHAEAISVSLPDEEVEPLTSNLVRGSRFSILDDDTLTSTTGCQFSRLHRFCPSQDCFKKFADISLLIANCFKSLSYVTVN